MEPTTIPEPAGFSELSKAEQIRYLQVLWDRIAERPGEIPVPESHLILAEDRLAEHRRDPSRAKPAHEILDRLANTDRGPDIGWFPSRGLISTSRRRAS